MNARSSTWARAFHDIVLSAHPYGWVIDSVETGTRAIMGGAEMSVARVTFRRSSEATGTGDLTFVGYGPVGDHDTALVAVAATIRKVQWEIA